MAKAPQEKEDNNKQQGNAVVRFLASLIDTIQLITSFANINNYMKKKSDGDWDEDWDDEYISKSRKITKADQKKSHQEYAHKQHKTEGSYKSFIYAIIFLLGIILCAIIFLNTDTSKRSLYLDEEQDTPQVKKTQLPPGQRKLEKPLFGNPDTPSQEMDMSDPLSKIDFDFSPTLSTNISRTPVLPEKVRKSKKSQNQQDFQDIWQNGNHESNSNLIDGDPSQPTSFLQPWRRFATQYPPTQGRPVFSIILEYDPDILDINDLPPGQGYNIVLPGFVNNADKIVKNLRAKGYEILLYLPMDSYKKSLNFKVITDKSNYDDIRNSIAFHTSQLGGEGFVGFMNYGGSKVRESLSKMNFMMSLLRKTGYLYIDNEARNPKSLAFAAAEGQKVPSLKVKNYIESLIQDFPPFIHQVKLDGQGIAIIKATPENILALNRFDTLIAKENLRRIPISGILKHQMLKTLK